MSHAHFSVSPFRGEAVAAVPISLKLSKGVRGGEGGERRGGGRRDRNKRKKLRRKNKKKMEATAAMEARAREGGGESIEENVSTAKGKAILIFYFHEIQMLLSANFAEKTNTNFLEKLTNFSVSFPPH